MILLFTNPLLAATYYVDAADANGNDANDGSSWEEAFETLGAAQAVADNGDTVYLKNGSYGNFAETTTVRTNWLTYQAATGHTAVDFNAVDVWASTYTNKYLKFVGINIGPGKKTSSYYNAVGLKFSNYVTVQDCNVRGNSVMWDYVPTDITGSEPNKTTYGMYVQFCNDVNFINCHIYGVGQETRGLPWIAWGEYRSFYYGMYLRNSDEILIQDCNVEGACLGIYTTDVNIIRVTGTKVHNISHDAFRLYDASNATIEDSEFYEIQMPIYITGISGIYEDANYDLLKAYFANVAAESYSSGTRTRITTNTPHGLSGGNRIRITGTVNYNGDYTVYSQGIDANHFVITKPYIAETFETSDAVYLGRYLITAGSGTPFTIIPATTTEMARVTKNGVRSAWWYINSHTGNTLTMSSTLGAAFNGDVTLIEVRRWYHADCLQVSCSNVSSTYSRFINAVIRRNKFHHSDEQGLFIRLGVGGIVEKGENILIENNLVYDTQRLQRGDSHGITIYECNNVTIANNTVTDNKIYIGYGMSNYRVANNISHYLELDAHNGSFPVSEDPDYEGRNICNSRGEDSGTFSWSTDDVYDNNQTDFEAIFKDYDTNDFSLDPCAVPSVAIDRANATYAPVADILMVTRDVTPDIGAYEYQLFTLEFTGTLYPNSTGDFVKAGIYDGYSYYYNSAKGWYDWWDTGDSVWMVSTVLGDHGAEHWYSATLISFSYGAVNGADGTGDMHMKLTGNHAPVLAAIGAKSVNENQPLTFVISATDADEDPIIYSASGLPSGAAFDSETKTFTWMPSYSQAGSWYVTFMAGDGTGLQDTETVTMTVNNRPQGLIGR